MESNKNGKGLIIALVILSILVLGLGGYIVYDKVISDKDVESNNPSNNQNIDSSNSDSQNEVEQPKTYKSYQIGDKVSLTDSSSWNVLENSTESDEFVTLLSIDNINKENNVTFKNAPTYVATTYKSNLITKINANNNDMKEARLLTLEDISKLSGMEVSKLVPGESLENNVTPSFLYQSETITSSIDQDCPIMVCSAAAEYYGTNPGRMCMGTQTDVFPIRPVIKIAKKYINN